MVFERFFLERFFFFFFVTFFFRLLLFVCCSCCFPPPKLTRDLFFLFVLQILFCEHGGSSSGVRRLLDESAFEGRLFQEFKSKNEHMEISLVKRNGQHPVLVGHYLEGRLLRDGNRVPKQICVKNEDAKKILNVMEQLKNETGGKAKSWNQRHWRAVESVQGVWTPLTKIA